MQWPVHGTGEMGGEGGEMHAIAGLGLRREKGWGLGKRGGRRRYFFLDERADDGRSCSIPAFFS